MQGKANLEIRIMKKPTGSPFPAAKNLSKLEGDQMGHIVFEPDSSRPLLRCITDQNERRSLALGSRKSRKRKKPPQVQPPLEGAACMGLWNTGIDFGWMCFTHPYYNKVGTRMIVVRPGDWRAKRKPANHVRCTQWAVFPWSVLI